MRFNNGSSYIELPPYTDTATVTLMSGGYFDIGFLRGFTAYDPQSGGIPTTFTLDLIFAGSPNTFAGGPLINSPPGHPGVYSNEYGIYPYSYMIMTQLDGSVAPIATPEPSTLMPMGTGLIGVLGFARKRVAHL